MGTEQLAETGQALLLGLSLKSAPTSLAYNPTFKSLPEIHPSGHP